MATRVASVWDDADADAPPLNQVVVLWPAKSETPPSDLVAKLGDAYAPRGSVLAMRYPYDNLSGQEARLNAQFYARKP